MTKTTRDLSDRHEAHVAEVLGGRQTRGSGNQWRDQTDGKNAKGDETYVFAWDGKATLAASTTVRLSDWEKVVEQGHGHRPALPLRFYTDARLTGHVDLVVIDLDDLAELREQANEAARFRAALERLGHLADALDG